MCVANELDEPARLVDGLRAMYSVVYSYKILLTQQHKTDEYKQHWRKATGRKLSESFEEHQRLMQWSQNYITKSNLQNTALL